MTNLLGELSGYVVSAAWELPLVAGAGWLAHRGSRRLGVRAEHLVWVVTFLLSVFAPMTSLVRWIFLFAGAPASSAAVPTAYSTLQRESVVPSTGLVISTGIQISLLVLCFGAVMMAGFRLVSSLWQMRRLLREASPLLLTAEQEEVWQHCVRCYSLPPIALYTSNEVSGPMTFGLGRPVLMLPEEFAQRCTKQDLLAALAHECAHIERRDFRKNLIYELLSLAVAFHPVCSMLKSQIAQTREMVCDEMVVERAVTRRQYAQSLLWLAADVFRRGQADVPSAIGIFDANILEKRIMVLHARVRQIRPFVTYAVTFPLLLLPAAAAVGGTTLSVPVVSTSTEQPGGGQHGEIYTVGKDASAPQLVFQVEPEFPKGFHTDKKTFEGVCGLTMVVDQRGIPHDVQVRRTLTPEFDKQAIEAVQQYRFKPAQHDGKPVSVVVKIDVNFQKF